MDINSIISSIVIGAAVSYLVACFFYRQGRIDTEKAYRRILLTIVKMRLKQMVPTRRQRTPEHYDLKDSAHWLTCFSECLDEAGLGEDSAVVKEVLRDIDLLPDIERPTKEQAAQADAKKEEWYRKIDHKISEIK